MSQHRFKTTDGKGREVGVLMGYDRRLNYYFMVVEQLRNPNEKADESNSDDESEFIYSNLNDPRGAFNLSLDEYASVLNELEIVVPRQMFEQVLIDGANGVGNRVVMHYIDGTFEERL